MHRYILAVLALALSTTACASRGPIHHGSRNVITAQEIATAGDVSTAYDAVSRLRPEFLTGRGTGSFRNMLPELPAVFINNMRLGGLEALAEIPVGLIRAIRFLTPGDATTWFGTGHMAGVIQVVTGQ